jgi:hypothetical protein
MDLIDIYIIKYSFFYMKIPVSVWIISSFVVPLRGMGGK